MRNETSRATCLVKGDGRLLLLERLWIRYFSIFEHTRDAEARSEAKALLAEIEQDMAQTPARTTRGLAAKLRCCIGREEQEMKPRPWLPLMRSLMADFDV